MERKEMEQTKKRKRDDELPCCDMFQAPIGIKFRPTEEVLLGHYLLNRAANKTTSLDGFMPDFELYGSATEVWEVWDLLGGPKLEQISTGTEGEMDIYLFTHLKKKSNAKKNGKNCIRTVGSGTWEAVGKAEQVLDDRGCRSCLGSKKRFKYVNRKHPHQNGQWTMLEFSLEGSSVLESNPKLPIDLVLCRIRKKCDKNLPKKRNRSVFEDFPFQEMLEFDEGGAELGVGEMVCILDHISEPEQVDHVSEKETDEVQENVLVTETTPNSRDVGVIEEEEMDEEEIMGLLSTEEDEMNVDEEKETDEVQENVAVTETTTNSRDDGVIEEEEMDEEVIIGLLSTEEDEMNVGEEKEAGRAREEGTEAFDLSDWAPSDSIEELHQSKCCYQSFVELLSEKASTQLVAI